MAYRRWFKSTLVLALIAGFLGSMLPVAHADELDEKRRQLQQIQEKIQQQQYLLKQTKKKEAGVLKELSRIEQDLDKTERDLRYLEGQLNTLNRKVKEAESELAEAIKSLNRRTGLLQGRVRAIYEFGTVSYVDVLLGARDFGDFLGRFELLRLIVSQDVELLRQVQEEKNSVEEKKANLEAQRAEVSALRGQVQQKKVRVSSLKVDRQNYLARIQKDLKAYERALDELNELSKQLERVIAEMQRARQRKLAGELHFAWPTDARTITSYFGNRYHPILKKNKMHTGIDIGVAQGKPVYASEGGEVIYSGWLGGYGYAVIIDHGGGWSTLYGHNSSLKVRVGQEVARGALIALAGSTGFSTGPHIHFEIRRDGVPQDPLNWLP